MTFATYRPQEAGKCGPRAWPNSGGLLGHPDTASKGSIQLSAHISNANTKSIRESVGNLGIDSEMTSSDDNSIWVGRVMAAEFVKRKRFWICLENSPQNQVLGKVSPQKACILSYFWLLVRWLSVCPLSESHEKWIKNRISLWASHGKPTRPARAFSVVQILTSFVTALLLLHISHSKFLASFGVAKSLEMKTSLSKTTTDCQAQSGQTSQTLWISACFSVTQGLQRTPPRRMLWKFVVLERRVFFSGLPLCLLLGSRA